MCRFIFSIESVRRSRDKMSFNWTRDPAGPSYALTTSHTDPVRFSRSLLEVCVVAMFLDSVHTWFTRGVWPLDGPSTNLLMVMVGLVVVPGRL